MLPSLNKVVSNINLSQILSNVKRPIQLNFHRTKYWHNRHRDPKFRTERGRKVWKVELPDFDEGRINQKKLNPDEVRSKMKERGIAPPSSSNEREIYSACTLNVIEPYSIPDGDGKFSSLVNLKYSLSKGTEFIKNRNAVKSIKSFEGDEFSTKEFAKESLKIYIKAHELLAAKEDQEIFNYVTEYCFPMMVANVNRHTILWKYLGNVEEPYVTQTRVGDMIIKGNKYAQITVRLHTKQILAIYDRHGRLVHGSPSDVKEVLEYVVFEKYLANEYGLWRLHHRLRPKETDAMLAEQVSKTYVLN